MQLKQPLSDKDIEDEVKRYLIAHPETKELDAYDIVRWRMFSDWVGYVDERLQRF